MNALEKLRPGDKVVYNSTGLGESWTVEEIARVTKLYIILKRSNMRFLISSGIRQGMGRLFDPPCIYPADTHHLQVVKDYQENAKRQGLIEIIKADSRFASLETLEAIYKLIHPDQATE